MQGKGTGSGYLQKARSSRPWGLHLMRLTSFYEQELAS